MTGTAMHTSRGKQAALRDGRTSHCCALREEAGNGSPPKATPLLTEGRRCDTVKAMPTSTQHVWYVSYGSNMASDRLRHYLSGGLPRGARRRHPGARDPRPPRVSRPVTVAGEVYFARTSQLWGGGVAFYDATQPGVAAMRAHLVTVGQFSDIAAQEMAREPASDLDLAPVLADGRAELGHGCYETLLHLGDLDGHPMLTFTAPWSAGDVLPQAPTAAYLHLLARGLGEGHGWDATETSAWLSQLRGARGVWSHEAISSMLGEAA